MTTTPHSTSFVRPSRAAGPAAGPSASVAVIGAGPGGLGTAMLLAAKGLKVTIYERQPAVGGRTGRISLGDYRFDRGPTFFLMPYVLDEIFAAAGRRLADYVELSRLDPMYRLIMGRAGQSPITIDCTQDIDKMAERIGAIDADDGRAFARFITDNRAKLRSFEPVLRKPFRSLADLLDPKLIAAAPHLHPTQSVHSLLGSYFKNKYSKLAVSFQSKYLGMSPMKCPALFSILPFIEYEYGIWHPRGGCNALMTAMAEVCTELGVDIHTNSPVETITFDGKKANGVVVNGQRQPHDHIVLNADASWAITNLIPPSLRTGTFHANLSPVWSDKKLQSMDYSCSTYMLYLGLTEPVDLPHHTIYISEQYEQNLEDISNLGVLSADPSTYVCNPARLDPSMAPPGHASLYVLVPTSNLKVGSIDWATQAAALREQALDRVSAMIGKPVRPLIAKELQLTPQDWLGQNIAFGATFNLAHNLTQMLHLRPQHELAGVENVWLAGGGTHPGSGLPVIFLSCQIAANKLAERVGA